jgi:hypothetical protein
LLFRSLLVLFFFDLDRFVRQKLAGFGFAATGFLGPIGIPASIGASPPSEAWATTVPPGGTSHATQMARMATRIIA